MRGRAGLLCAALTLAAILAVPGLASAALPPFLKQFGESGGGEAAGEIATPLGVATNALTGHLYVADTSNGRIDEFTPWGEFVKAFGWDVAPGAVDEEQEARVRATAGTFRLSFGVSTTGDLPFDASAEQVETALNALPSVSAGGGGVDVSGGPGGIAGATPSVYVVSFVAGSLAATNVAQLGIEDGTVPLSGGSPTLAEVLTRADGTSGGSGLESCTTASGCKAGVNGTGAGQFTGQSGVAVDSAGNVYTFERPNLRLQKFDSAGRFLWMVGGEVNKTTGDDICTQADVDALETCGAGVSGSGPREFTIAHEGTLRNYIAIAPSGNLFVADETRIQEVEPDGDYVGEIEYADVHAQEPSFPASGIPRALAIDPLSEDIYFAFWITKAGEGSFQVVNGVFRLSPDGQHLATLENEKGEPVHEPETLATDPAGSLYVAEDPRDQFSQFLPAIVKYDASGDLVIPYSEGFAQVQFFGMRLPSLGTNSVGNVFVGVHHGSPPEIRHVDAYGPAPVALEPPLKVPPTIADQYAVSVEPRAASLRAEINPHFWSDTRFYVEYGTQDCSLGGCAKAPSPPGSLLTKEVVDTGVKSPVVFLDGLQPGTTYHYRFVTASIGGGPVVGAGVTFTTPRPPSGTAEPCPANDAYRTGPSAALPDCRAYELVTPLDKNGGDVVPLCEASCYSASLDQAAISGSALTYSTYKSYGDAESAPYSAQYLARRNSAEGWENHSIVPAQDGLSELDVPYKAFTADLEFGWLSRAPGPALAPGTEVPNFYRRDNGDGAYQALAPQALDELAIVGAELQGVSDDGRCAVLRVNDALTEEAKPALVQVYRSCEGFIDLVSILPSGTASSKPSSAGTPQGSLLNGRENRVESALSADGSRVFWSEAEVDRGPLYVRIGGAFTRAVSAGAALFWGASADGTKVVYDEAAKLFEATIDEAGVVTRTQIAGEALGVMGMSEDASRVYFASRADLDGGGAAQSGELNLYLREEGANEFVVALAEADLDPLLSPLSPRPVRHQARVNRSGSHLVFMSRGQLTGYESTDQVSDEADAQVFLYDAEADELRCVSCNPTGARPVGRELHTGIAGSPGTGVWAAGKIPTFQSQLHGSQVLSEDGSRLFFESYDALVPADTNGKQDVYQWEEPGTGGCEESDPSFQPPSGGCLDLISSGKSSGDSSFVDASADGEDVFVRTSSSLLPYDPGLVDIYDARVDGGLPAPPSPPAGCAGEACQTPQSAPSDPTPASASFHGPADPKVSRSIKRRCAKGKRLTRRGGRARCVERKGKAAKRAKRHNGRTAR